MSFLLSTLIYLIVAGRLVIQAHAGAATITLVVKLVITDLLLDYIKPDVSVTLSAVAIYNSLACADT